jgi:UDP-2-acetamido-3-amino-2,3-dideoxy-glucuronate N-acetyltransferase
MKNKMIHDSCFIDENVSIGEGTKIWHYSHIQKNATIGDNVSIGQNVNTGPNISIGNDCKIQNNVSIYEGVTLEDGVFCGPSCVFTNVTNPRAFIQTREVFGKTLVKKGASIGANATIVCGSIIGKYSLIGAGAVVTKDVPNYALVYGNPAKQYGWVSRLGHILDESLICPESGNQYEINELGELDEKN